MLWHSLNIIKSQDPFIVNSLNVATCFEGMKIQLYRCRPSIPHQLSMVTKPSSGLLSWWCSLKAFDVMLLIENLGWYPSFQKDILMPNFQKWFWYSSSKGKNIKPWLFKPDHMEELWQTRDSSSGWLKYFLRLHLVALFLHGKAISIQSTPLHVQFYMLELDILKICIFGGGVTSMFSKIQTPSQHTSLRYTDTGLFTSLTGHYLLLVLLPGGPVG